MDDDSKLFTLGVLEDLVDLGCSVLISNDFAGYDRKFVVCVDRPCSVVRPMGVSRDLVEAIRLACDMKMGEDATGRS